MDAGFDLDRWYAIEAPTLAGRTEESLAPFAQPDWNAMDYLGYLRTPSYYDLFLQPLVGSVGYGVWRLLKCLYYAPRQRFTRERRIAVDHMSSRLRCHRQAITGCLRRRDGQRTWQPGAFDALQREAVAAVREEGNGRRRSYRVRALNSPPILTPIQAGRLSPVLQEAHDKWIEYAQLDLKAWYQLDLPLLSDLDDDEEGSSDVPQATRYVQAITPDVRPGTT